MRRRANSRKLCRTCTLLPNNVLAEIKNSRALAGSYGAPFMGVPTLSDVGWAVPTTRDLSRSIQPARPVGTAHPT